MTPKPKIPFLPSSEVRRQFISFFEKRGHTFVPSSSVVPLKDPTLLFANAGMNQFKDIFLGQGTRSYSRAVNTQKCIRVSGKHNDLEEVGRGKIHHTFFEMLGNWSFGDYYKQEAISWAWELITGVWKLPKDKLFATVYLDDDEADKIWRSETDVKSDHISRHDKDNFWEMGEAGPCGPCSEIHIDLGPGTCPIEGIAGHKCEVNAPGCGRFVELWNLVFIQYNRDEKGELHDLPAKHVDTGAGLERLCTVLQGVKSNYETDLFRPIIDRIEELTGSPYDTGDAGVGHRVVADHLRSLSFAIADGARPSNEGRGYVLRRILRRAARFGRSLGLHRAFIHELVEDLAEIMGDAFPEIPERSEHISGVIRGEEESFGRTLDRGIDRFAELVDKIKRDGEMIIPGSEAFKLYDTFGFPLDLTELMAREQGMTVDVAAFQKAMSNQKERSRASGKFAGIDEKLSTAEIMRLTDDCSSEFAGYTELVVEDAKITGYQQDGDRINLVLSKTPFYAEAGGQVGDTGQIFSDRWEMEVEDTQVMGDDILHTGKITAGLRVFEEEAKAHFTEPVTAVVDQNRRLRIARNHTATHLMHAALRKVLGKHVNQSGSLVHPDYLRFDFTHFEKPSEADLDKVEEIVNEKISQALPLRWEYTSFEDAKNRGAMALFGEKYGEEVRLVTVDDFSAELCGGTHVNSTEALLAFRIASESAAAAGIRRIEAWTGDRALHAMLDNKHLLRSLQDVLSARGSNVLTKVEKLVEEHHDLMKQVERLKKTSASDETEELIDNAQDVEGVKLVTAQYDDRSMDDLKKLGDVLREKNANLVAVLGSSLDSRASIVVVVSDDLITSKKLSAGKLVKEIGSIAGGGGGGRDHLGTAGAKSAEKLPDAIDKAGEILAKVLK
ncbi:alanine--tRNA ligase [candidate division LCP-89 bacterium B3_LCP]|uniref:Alanine--tRNA ligase n=1 Tax=candidate division LCP-89 bacterium B3_LCP TaxID=2012998 RepID=A0A532URI5_UNCL8|nr:MAG: alanine--tRNA ligase [candidate division LCP-89 bacterium B3_LCP]